MFFVPDGTDRCGFYECEKCGDRFLSLTISPRIPCPGCDSAVDYEIGPDEEMPKEAESAVLLEVIEGEENVEKCDNLLSLAITGGEYDWI